MNPRPSPATIVAPPSGTAVSGLAALAFGSDSLGMGAAKHLAFLPLESLELDLADPEQRDFGDYELIEQLGQGGMGVVYRARQKSLQREVAVKLLSAGPWASREFIARFTREAQNAARLEHPNIVSIFEIGVHAEMNFFSMQLVRSESLAQRLDRGGPLPPRNAAQLVRRIAEALDYAHRLGILHLDLKPANVLLDEHGEPQVADFGLARRLDEALAGNAEEVSGTPSYMAPEQAQGHPLGVGTDIYGLGAILYELLCGRPPFLGATARETLQQVVADPLLPLCAHRPGLDPDLEAICLHCLQRDPSRRYPDARMLADDLGRYLEGHPVGVRPLNAVQRGQRWAKREPVKAVLGIGFVIALLAGLYATERQRQRAEAATAQVRQTLWQNRLDEGERLLREGRLSETLPGLLRNLEEQTAAAEPEAIAATRLRLGSVLGEVPRPIDSLALGVAASSLSIDPEGRWLVIALQSGEVRRYDLPAGEVAWVAKPDPRLFAPLVAAADGEHLILSRTGVGGALIDLENGNVRQPPVIPDGLWGAVYATDGRHALAGAASGDGAAPRMHLVDTADWNSLGEDVVQPSGSILLAPGGHAYANYLGDPETGTVSRSRGGCEPDTICVASARDGRPLWRYRHAPGSALRDWKFSPDGSHLAVGIGDGEVRLFRVADGAGRVLQPQPQFKTPAAGQVESGSGQALRAQLAPMPVRLFWSPDGRWLGASYYDGTVQVWDGSSGELAAPPLRLGDEGGARLDFHPAQGLLATYEQKDRSRLWHLPGNGQALTLVQQRPAMARPVWAGTAGFAPGPGLIAAVAGDGELRLWRYRERRTLPARAPAQTMPGSESRIDANYVLDVRGVALQRRRLADGEPAGPTMRLPQVPGFAQLLPDSPWVVASAGRHVHVLNAVDGQPRYPAIELPATPGALLPHIDGHRAIAAWPAKEGERHVLVLRSVDLDHGATLAEASLPGTYYDLRLAEAGDALLAWRYGVLPPTET